MGYCRDGSGTVALWVEFLSLNSARQNIIKSRCGGARVGVRIIRGCLASEGIKLYGGRRLEPGDK